MRPRPQRGARRRERPSIKNNDASQEKKGASTEKRGKFFLKNNNIKGIDNDVSQEKKGASNEKRGTVKKKLALQDIEYMVKTVSEKRGKVFLRMMIQKGIDNDVSQEKKGASNEREGKKNLALQDIEHMVRP